VCGIRILNPHKAQPLIEPSGAGALRSETNTLETLPRFFDERRHKRSANSFVPPLRPDIHSANAADLRIAGERIEIQASDGDQLAFIETAKECLARPIETIDPSCPIVRQSLNKFVTFSPSLRPQVIDAANGQCNPLDLSHRVQNARAIPLRDGPQKTL
jgi:hypothetical protein